MYKLIINKPDGSFSPPFLLETQDDVDFFISNLALSNCWGDGITTTVTDITTQYNQEQAIKSAYQYLKDTDYYVIRTVLEAYTVSQAILDAREAARNVIRGV
jgi:hypothetical protein